MLTHPKNWIIDKFFVSLHNTKNQSNWTEHQFYMAKNVSNMTWHLFVNIFHFYILLNSQPALSTRIPDFFFSIKLRNMWERHVFVHIILQNNLWSWQASVCFREAATKQSLTKQVHSKKVRAFNYRVTAKAKFKK